MPNMELQEQISTGGAGGSLLQFQVTWTTGPSRQQSGAAQAKGALQHQSPASGRSSGDRGSCDAA